MERKPSGKYFTALDGVFKKREYIYCLKKKKKRKGAGVGGSGEEGGRILLHGEDANTCQIPLVKGGGGPPPQSSPLGGAESRRGGGPGGAGPGIFGCDRRRGSHRRLEVTLCDNTHRAGLLGGFGRRSCRRV